MAVNAMVTNEKEQWVKTDQSEADQVMVVLWSQDVRGNIEMRSSYRVHYTSHITGTLSPSSDKHAANMIPKPSAPSSLNISAE